MTMENTFRCMNVSNCAGWAAPQCEPHTLLSTESKHSNDSDCVRITHIVSNVRRTENPMNTLPVISVWREEDVESAHLLQLSTAVAISRSL